MDVQPPPPPHAAGALMRPVLTEAEAHDLISRFMDGAGAESSVDLLMADYQTLRTILDRSAAGIGVLDQDQRYVYINDALAGLNGIPAADHLGRTVRDMLPDLDHGHLEAVLSQVLRDGRPRSITLSGRTPSDPKNELRWWINAYHRLEDESGAVLGVAAVVVEVSESYRVRRLLDAARNRLALLDEAATRISASLDVDQVCRELARLMVPRLADFAAVDVLESTDAHIPAPARYQPRGQRPAPHSFRRIALAATPSLARAGEYLGAPGAMLIPQPTSAVARCLAERRPIVMNHPTDQQMAQAALSADRIAQYRELGLHSAVFVPLTVRRDFVGVVVLGRAGDSPPFTPRDVDLVAELARRASTSISHARRFAQEHQTALLLQQALLARPRPPHADVECASRYLPTGKDIEIGGDWYDTVALPDGKTLLVVGDVMGHGVEAAAAMSEYRGLLRTLALQSCDPAAILGEAARIADGLAFDRVATCIVAVLDPVAQTCTVASAGHLPPLLVDRSGDAKLLGIPVDPPLGIGEAASGPGFGSGFGSGSGTETGIGTRLGFDYADYSRTTISFPPGSILLCYTDGLVERRGEDIEECVSELARLDLDPAQPLEQLVDRVLCHFDPAGFEDDVALLCARFTEADAWDPHADDPPNDPPDDVPDDPPDDPPDDA